jgi:hypothetical protein
VKRRKTSSVENMGVIIVVFILVSGSVGWTFWFSQLSF